jgi:hypothetical protein
VTALTLRPATVTLTFSSFSAASGAREQFTATGGTPSYRFSNTAPDMGTINPVTGLYTLNSPPTEGTDTIIVVDAFGLIATATLTLDIL